MKTVIKYIITVSTLLLVEFLAFGQDQDIPDKPTPEYTGYNTEGGVATKKTCSDPVNGTYTITLETFATGEQTVVQKSVPADIILVLDASNSMSASYYIPTTKTWDQSDFGSVTYYYNYNGAYQQVRYRNGYLQRNGWGNNWTNIATLPYEGTLYTRTTRWAALKDAVNDFIKVVRDNNENLVDLAEYGNVGNRVAIVTYGHSGNATTNISLTDVDEKDSFSTAIDNMQQSQGTYSNEGMALAKSLLSGISANRAKSIKTVVLFTDGMPGENQVFSTEVANETISHAKDMKTGVTHPENGESYTYKATVYTVGIFDDETEDIKTYMEYTSSDYPNAVSMTVPGEGGGDDKGYYKLVGESGLSEIFTKIAEGSGGENEELGVNTEVRDVLSSSFELPINTSEMEEDDINAWIANNVTVQKARIKDDASGWYDPVDFNDASITINGNKVSVTGFNYGSTENFVGPRWDSENKKWYYDGFKLIISFPIEGDPNSTGGGTATNTTESGVYVGDTKINTYEVPQKILSVKLKIEKEGLRKGESATFVIYKATPKADSDGNYVTNALGKAIPNDDWVEHSRVILSNMTATGDKVVKIINGLDPNFVYRIDEGDWSWSYTTTGVGSNTTADKAENPFTFRNTEKTNVQKHGEAVSVNHFGENAHTETAKSDKKAR